MNSTKSASYKLIVIIFLCFNIQSAFAVEKKPTILADSSGWVDTLGYKQERMRIGNISFIQYSKDGQHFYTFSSDSTFRTWEVSTGKLVDEFHIPYSCTSISLSPDEQKLAISPSTNPGNGNSSMEFIDSIIIYNIVKKTKNITINPTDNFINDMYDGDRFLNSQNIILFTSDTTLMNVTNAYIIYGWGENKHKVAYIEVRNINNGIVIQHIVSYLPYISTAKSTSKKNYYSYYINYSDFQYDGSNDYTITENYIITLLDSNFNKIMDFYSDYNSQLFHQGDKYNPIAHKMVDMYFTGNMEYFVGLYDINQLYFWDLLTGTLEKTITLGTPSIDYYPSDIAFPENNKYFITGSINPWGGCSIRYWDINSGINIDSINFNNNIGWKFALSNNSFNFLGAGTDGFLRLFSSTLLNVEKNLFNEKKVYIFPNPTPGQGTIKLTTIQPGNIEIKLYSLAGAELKEITNQYYSAGLQEIPFDESGLAPGIYFYSIWLNGRFLSYGKIAIVK